MSQVIERQQVVGVLKKAVREDVESHFVPSLQAKLDLIARTYRGRPVEEVATALSKAVAGSDLGADTWRRPATAISQGRRVRVELKLPIGW